MREYVCHTEWRYELHTTLSADAESVVFISNQGMNFTPRYPEIQGVWSSAIFIAAGLETHFATI